MPICYKIARSVCLVGFAITMAAALPWALAESPATRRLYSNVTGFELNEAAADVALKAGGDINWQNPAMGEETMLITALKGQKDSHVIEWVVQHGADPNIRDKTGRTALDYALERNLANNSDGRKIIAALQGAAGGAPAAQAAAQPATRDFAQQPAAARMAQQGRAEQPISVGGVNPLAGATASKDAAAPTPAEVKKLFEEGFRSDYRNHFSGVDNKVTVEWLGPIQISGREPGSKYFGMDAYSAKIQARVTVEDPRDGHRMTVIRGINADYGFIKKREMFRLLKNAFGEWEYSMYEF